MDQQRKFLYSHIQQGPVSETLLNISVAFLRCSADFLYQKLLNTHLKKKNQTKTRTTIKAKQTKSNKTLKNSEVPGHM